MKLGLEGCDIRDNGEENIREIMEGVKGIKNLQVLGLDLGGNDLESYCIRLIGEEMVSGL